MKCFALVFTLCANFIISEALKCDRLECPKETATCSVNFAIKDFKKKYTNVACYDFSNVKILQDNYETILDNLPFALPIIECGGYKCKQGSVSCLSLRKFQFENFHSNETLQLLCKDADGATIEERNFINEIEPNLTIEVPPLICEGYTCPHGSLRCTFDTTIQLDPYKKSTVVTCYDFKNATLIQTVV
ncbi:uncharacterized protein LOC143910406 [Arctopsyche grandis]|uniref:uncharacterized protein LOC143910406 n=1 Tax=Arctopsyche grandis TaxID=121162 RepID=UPI00406D8599